MVLLDLAVCIFKSAILAARCSRTGRQFSSAVLKVECLPWLSLAKMENTRFICHDVIYFYLGPT